MHTDTVQLATSANANSTITIDLSAATTFREFVTDPVVAVTDQVRGATEQHIVVVLISDVESVPTDIQAMHEAAFAALRGAVGALTRERAHAGLQINLVRSATREAAEFTVDYLESAAAGFTAGATLDLTGQFA